MNKYFKIALVAILVGGLFMITSCKKNKGPKTQYTITYDANGGVFSNNETTITETYDDGALVNINKAPTREDFQFTGWINKKTNEEVGSSLTIKENLTLVANWETDKIQITYRSTSSGKFIDGTTERVVYVDEGTPFSYNEIPVASDDIKMFNGWFDKDSGEYVVEGTIVNEDMVVNAKYRNPGVAYEIQFVLNGGTQDRPTQDTYYRTVNYQLPIPTKDGFAFLGWYETSDFASERVLYQNDQAKDDKIYYAKWEIIDPDAASVILDELVPNEVSHNVNLATEYQGATITWEINDTSLMNLQGEINPTHQNEKMMIKCQMVVNGNTINLEKEITVKAIVFEEVTNPIAGYFYATPVTHKTDALLDNLNIIYYAFAAVSNSGSVSMGTISRFNELMKDASMLRQKGIKIVLSVNGGAANFAAACRKSYVDVAKGIVNLVSTYHLDGVDIDWEFPTETTDTNNLTNLCRSIKEQLAQLTDGNGSPYIVTAAIPSSSQYSKFNLGDLNNVLDYVNMMSYDMNLSGKTSHLCPLLTARNDGNLGDSVERGIERFTRAGLDKNKIIIGAAFYGEGYKVLGPGPQAKYPGLGAAAELNNLSSGLSSAVTYAWIYQNALTDRKYVRYYDEEAQAVYLYNEEDQIFITYEDEESLTAKVEYAYKEGVGIMFWAYAQDYQNHLTDTICNKMAELKNGNN